MLLLLPGHRQLGEFALEQVGQSLHVQLPAAADSDRGGSRRLHISTYADGPTRVLRVLDAQVHTSLAGAAGAATQASARSSAHPPGGSGAATPARGGGNGSGVGSSPQQRLRRALATALAGVLKGGDAGTPAPGSVRRGAAAAADGQQQVGTPGGRGGATPQQAAQAAAAAAAERLWPGRADQHHRQQLASFLAPALLPESNAEQLPPAAGAPAASVAAAYAFDHALQPPLQQVHQLAALPAVPAPPPRFQIDVRLRLRGAGLSLVSHTQELLYASCHHVLLRAGQDAVRRVFGCAVGVLQVENTLQEAQYRQMISSPVSRSVLGVIYPRLDRARTAAAAAAASADGAAATTAAGGAERWLPSAPALAVLCTLWRDQPGGVLCFEQLHLQLAPVALSLEGLHLKLLRDFALTVGSGPASSIISAAGSGGVRRAAGRGSGGGGGLEGFAAGLAAVAAAAPPPLLPPQAGAAQKLYFDEVTVSEIQICITAAPGSWFTSSPAPGSSGAAGGQASAAGAHGGMRAVGAGTAAVFPGSSSGAGVEGEGGDAPPAWWTQLVLSLAHTEGAWLRLAPFRRRHPLLSWDGALQVRAGVGACLGPLLFPVFVQKVCWPAWATLQHQLLSAP